MPSYSFCGLCGGRIKTSKSGGEYCTNFCIFTGDAKRKKEQEESHQVIKNLPIDLGLPF